MNYDSIQTNKELKANARQQLRGAWGQMALACFVMYLFFIPNTILSGINQLHEINTEFPSFPILSLLVMVVTGVISGPFYLGFAGYFLKRMRGENIVLGNIFEGFKRFWPAFFLLLLLYIFTFLWTLLLVVPGIIKGLGYSLAFFILHDNPGMKAREALKKSQIMMKGYKGKLFLLGLSFIGWILLSILSAGIGYLWLSPYMGVSFANFYENLKKQQGQESPEAQKTTGISFEAR